MKSATMNAIICTQYGAPEVLQLQQLPKPTPKANEVLIKIHAASVTRADTIMRTGMPYIGRLFLGLTKPKYPVTGTGFAGEIEAIGEAVTQFQPGDKVFGESVFGSGTHAEYLCLAEDALVTKIPENTSYDEVASICDGPLTSLNLLRDKAKIQPGQKVLIIGASGALGTAAVQLAKHFGTEVTGVCSTPNVELVKGLGADHVIDYRKSDFTENGQTYDIIYDTVGKSSFSNSKGSLTSNGIYLSPVMGFRLLLQMIGTSIFGKKKVLFDATGFRPIPELRPLLQELKGLMEKGQLKTVIDRYYPLAQVGEAHRYVDTGRKKGNVVIRVG